MPASRGTHDPALMGYIGGVSITGLGTVRANSASLNAKQTIDHPEVIDGTTDWTLYQLRGIEVDGDVSLPVVAGEDFLTGLFALVARNPDGTLTQVSDVNIVYGAGSGSFSRNFQGCLCNTLEVRASAGDKVDATINFWGRNFTEGGPGPGTPPSGVRRILSWADVLIEGSFNSPCDIKEFSLNVNNSLSRNYTFCAEDGYFPNNISAGKRQVSGSIGFIGGATSPPPSAGGFADISPNGGTITATIGGFTVTLNNIMYEFQTIEAQPGLITSTVNYYAHSVDGTAIEV